MKPAIEVGNEIVVPAPAARVRRRGLAIVVSRVPLGCGSSPRRTRPAS